MNWVYNDGGRADAGFKGEAGDCVTRAIAIAMDRPYKEVYNELASEVKLAGVRKVPVTGLVRKLFANIWPNTAGRGIPRCLSVADAEFIWGQPNYLWERLLPACRSI